METARAPASAPDLLDRLRAFFRRLREPAEPGEGCLCRLSDHLLRDLGLRRDQIR